MNLIEMFHKNNATKNNDPCNKPSFNPCKYFNPKFQRMAAELGEHATFLQVSSNTNRINILPTTHKFVF